MAFLAAVAPYLAAAGTAFSVYSQIQQGKQANLQGQLAGIQHDRIASNIESESQREAIQAKKQSKYLAGRARAVAAASGAGTDNVNVENLIGDIEAEGEYQKLAALYSGKTDADLSRFAGGAARREGRAARTASRYSAASTLLSGAGNAWQMKYG